MRAALDEIATVVGGRLSGPDVTVTGASIDSRDIAPGQLFVPVVAERDGHDFVDDALDRGAAGYLTSREARHGSAVVVEDTQDALTQLGSWARDRLPERVVGVTGSAGKTSTKDLLAAVLRQRFRTAANARSFNNELGVPLTLLNAPDDCEAAVVEMGARAPGHIASLCRVARPTVGVMTNIGPAHLEMFGSVDGVAEAKGELVEALPRDGVAVLNAADERVAAMAARTQARVLTFAVEPTEADVRAVDVALDGHLRPSFLLLVPSGETRVRLQVRGRHQIANALAAAAAGLALGMNLDDVAAGLARAELSPWRMDVRTAPSGAIVVNDSYNANPASTEAALRALAELTAARRVAVLGTMAELGPAGGAEHRRVAAIGTSLGIEVLAVDEAAYGVEQVAGIEGALRRLAGLGAGDAVLVKGSRVAGLERLAEALLA